MKRINYAMKPKRKQSEQCSKLKGTLSAALPGIKKLLSIEFNESPRSFLMSSSSLSRHTPLNTLPEFVSKPSEGTTASAALDLNLTPTSGLCGALAAAAAVMAALLLRKRFPFRLCSLLDCAESCPEASGDWAAAGGWTWIPKSEV